jgi:small subunit ribosomal protein S20
VAHSLSAKKRIRQNTKRRAQSRGRKGQLRAVVRAFNSALQSGDASKSAETLKAAAKKLDQVAATGSIHKNTASRKKSRLQRKLNALAKADS